MMTRRLNIFLSFFIASTFSYSYSADYFWVNNSGDWNDAMHWSFASGGVGGAGIPSQGDNVFFDNNSFSSHAVVSLGASQSLHDFTFTNNQHEVSFDGITGSEVLEIQGSFSSSNRINTFSPGKILLTSNQPAIFNSGMTIFNSDIEFSGNYQLLGPLSNVGNGNGITISGGNFVSNNHSIETDKFLAPGNSLTNLDLGSSLIQVDFEINLNLNQNLTVNNASAGLAYDFSVPLSRRTGVGGFGSSLEKGTNNCASGITIIVTVRSAYNGSQISCNGLCDAIIDIAVVDPTLPVGCAIEVQKVPDAFTPDSLVNIVGDTSFFTYTGFCAGSYTFLAREDCDIFKLCDESVGVVEPTALAILPPVTTNPNCPDSCDGTGQVFAFGGTGLISYTWPTSLELSNLDTAGTLCDGVNTVAATDANGCFESDDFILVAPDAFDLNITTTPLSCNGICNGTATSAPTGGSGAIGTWTFDWDTTATPNGDGTQTIIDLCARTIGILDIVDGNGCPFRDTFEITEPTALQIDSVNQANLICNAVCIGELEVSTSDGTLPYTSFQWYDAATDLAISNPGNATENVTSLCAGTYYMIAIDANLCEDTSQVFNVTEPPAISFTTTPTDALCEGVCDGELAWTAAGGSGTISSELFLVGPPDVSQGSVNPTTGLCVGDYYVVHTDDSACVQFSDTVTINEPAILDGTASGNPPPCNGDATGDLSVVVTGGSGVYIVEWFTDAGVSTGLFGETVNGFFPAGCYYGLISDAASPTCQTESDTICLIDPPAIAFTTTAVDATCFGTCDGEVSWTSGGGTGIITSELFLVPFISQGNANPTSTLCPGDYYVVHTDGNSCVQNSDTVTVAEPAEIVGTTSGTDPLCNGDATGTATVAVVGGSGLYDIAWFDAGTSLAIGQVTLTATGLVAGCYYAEITDQSAPACIVFSDTVCITDPAVISFTTTAVDATCFGTCDGEVSWTASGGVGIITSELFLVGPPDVSQGNANPTSTLCIGDYYVVHTDGNLCVQNSDTVTVAEPAAIVGTTSGNDPLCNGGNSGDATVAIVGGSGLYDVEWFDVTPLTTGQTTLTATGLIAGCYYAVITDQSAPACAVESDTTCLIDPPAIAFTTTAVDATCFGTCDGEVSWTSGGGTGIITSELFLVGPPDVSQGNANPTTTLCIGDYYVVHTDGNLCVQNSDTVTVAEPTELSGIVTGTDPLCINESTGSLSLAPAGGSGVYIIEWFDALTGLTTGQFGLNVLNLFPEGCYYAEVTDASTVAFPTPCTVNSDTLCLVDPTPITFTTAAIDATCFGTCDGQVSWTASGGTGLITSELFLIGPPDVSQGNANPTTTLCPGDYYVVHTDDNLCVENSDTVTVSEPTEIVGVTNGSDPFCNGESTGSLGVTIVGGSGAYDVEWFDVATSLTTGQTGTTVTNLMPAGCYYAVITDQLAPACTVISDTTCLTDPDAIVIAVTPVEEQCNSACDGSASAVVSGGTGPLTVSWTFDPSGVSAGPDGLAIADLCADNYIATVTDGNLCTGTANFTIDPAPVLDVTVVDTPISCTNNCDGSAVATPTGGTGVLTVSWFDVDAGYTSAGPDGLNISGLCFGDYAAVVTDGNGCSDTALFTLVNHPPLLITANITDETCFGACDGEILINASGGTGGYTYQLNGGGFGPINPVVGLCQGTYDLDVQDATGCIVSMPNQPVGGPTEIILDLTITEETCFGDCDGSIEVLASGGAGGYTYSWSSSGNTTDTETGLCQGSSPVTLTVSDLTPCTIDTVITFTGPAVLDATVITTPPICAGASQGIIDIDATGGLQFSGGQYNYSITGGAPFTMAINPFSFTNLPAGSYDVLVEDSNGCQYAETVVIIDPAGCVATGTPTAASCGGFCDGAVDVTITGCVGPFQHQWYELPGVVPIPVPGGNTQIVTGLCSNLYFDSITDLSTGCVFSSDTISVTESPTITGVLSFFDVSCNGFCDGSASVIGGGGTPGYTYDWFLVAAPADILIQSGVSDSIFGLCAGQYYVEIVDINLCRSAPFLFDVFENPPLTAPLTTADALCFGICDGTADVVPAGGDGTYTVVWDDLTNGIFDFDPGSVLSQSTLCAGDYQVTVTDGNGCSVGPQFFTIGENAEITISVATTDETCFGDNDGTAIATPTNGSATYTYSWTSDLGEISDTDLGISPGSYTVSLTDGDGCAAGPEPFTIDAAIEITATLNPSTLLCNGDLGSISVIASGGDGSYDFQWDASTGSQVTNPAINLAAGTYCVDITDGLGCTVGPFCETIIDVPVLSATSSTTEVLCNGGNTGTATVTPSGGTGTYDYLWDASTGSQVTQTAVGLIAGTYSCTVTDDNGCDLVVNGIIVDEPDTLDLTFASTDASCFGGTDGAATAIVTGGTLTYSYQWDPATGPPAGGQTTNPAVGLAPGTYGLTVTDLNLCTFTDSVTIGEGAEITATTSSTDATCGAVPCDGTATANALGGTGTLQYEWFDAGGVSVGVGITATSLCAGAYTVVITDDNLCSDIFPAVVNNPVSENITTNVIQDETCVGDEDGIAEVIFTCSTAPGDCDISWSTGGFSVTETNMPSGTHTVTVTNSVTGCSSSEFVTINPGDLITLTMGSVGELCFNACNGTANVVPAGGDGSYTYAWTTTPVQTASTAANLCPGTYDVTVTDGQLCSATSSIVVDPAIEIVVSLSATDENCSGSADGTASASVVGGTGTYDYLWNTTPPQITQTATGLSPGVYSVTVTDDNGCSVLATPAVVGAPTALSVVMTSTPPDCNGDNNATATATPSGGNGTYVYNWQQGGLDLVPPQNTPTAVGLSAGTYTVQVFDTDGCQLIPDGEVTIIDPPALAATTDSTEVTCDGDSDGTATVFPTGGTPLIDVVWDITTGSQTGPTAVGLPVGTYTATITDGNLCALDVDVTVTSPGAVTGVVVSTDSDCFEDSTGSASITVSGGIAGYDIDWSNGFSESGVSTSALSNLGPDNYSVDVTDVNGCSETYNFTVTENSEITASFAEVPSTCSGTDGSLTVSPSGGSPGYTFIWQPPASGTSPTISGMAAGCYDVIITDSSPAGCSQLLTGCITDIGAEALVPTPTGESCFGFCDGVIDLASPCLDPACTYELFDEFGVSISGPGAVTSFTGLCTGDYIVSVVNNTGCQTFENVTVGGTGEIFANAAITDPSCGGVSDGEIALNPSGGIGVTYTIDWTNPAVGPTNPITGLSAASGPFTVTITDVNSGCTKDTSINLIDPSILTGTEEHADPLCFGDCNGTITATPIGGTGPYEYSLNGGLFQSSPVFTSLCPSVNTVTVRDVFGCTFDITGITLTEPPLLVLSATGEDPNCFNACDGELDASAVGGSGVYTFTWTVFGVGASHTGVCDGSYDVTVIDTNSCSAGPISVVLTEPAIIDTTDSGIVDIVCNGDNDGEAFITVAGGNGEYTYFWGPSSLPDNDTVTGLSGGLLWVYVEDSSGCLMDTIFMNVAEPTAVTATSSSVSATCLLDNGTATINPTGGTPTYTFQWDAGTAPPAPGQTTQTAVNLPAGSYDVEVTDFAGCVDTFNVAVSNITAPSIVIDSITDVSCFGGSDGEIFTTISGGSIPYDIVWTPGGGATEDTLGLVTGVYQISVTDGDGCIVIADTTVATPALIVGTTVGTDPLCNGESTGTATVSLTGGSGGYDIEWFDTTGTSIGQTTTTAVNLPAGCYYVVISDTAAPLCGAISDTVCLEDPAVISFTTLSSDISCFGTCDGEVAWTASGGVGDITSELFLIGTPDVLQADSATLCAGDYFLVHTDTNLCAQNSDTVTVAEPTLIVGTTTGTDPLCNGDSTGTTDVAIVGGSGGYDIEWFDTTGVSIGQLTSGASNLPAGCYYAVITDASAAGCVVNSDTICLEDPLPISFTTTASDATCFGVCDGEVSWTNAGGVGIISSELFLIGTPDVLQTDSAALCPGDYYVIHTDTNLCAQNSDTVSIGEPTLIVGTTAGTDPLCNGDATGTATVAVVGGSGGYTIEWFDTTGASTGIIGDTAINLIAGCYFAVITDTASAICVVNSDTICLTDPLPISFTTTTTDITCFGACDGEVSWTASGGVSAITSELYLIGTPDVLQPDSTVLCPGDYFIVHTDTNLCIQNSDTVTITEPDLIVGTTNGTDPLCNGDSTGTATVVIVGGSGSYDVEWFDTTGTSIGQLVPNAINLPAGCYYAVISNTALPSCTVISDTVCLVDPDAISFTTVPEDVTCFGACNGEVAWTAAGGSGVLTSELYLIGTPDVLQADSAALCPGDYFVVHTDTNLCVQFSDTVVISEPIDLVADLPIVGNASCVDACNGSATLNISGGSGTYTYDWSSGSVDSVTVNDLCVGITNVMVTDSLGCTVSQAIIINENNTISASTVTTDATCGSCDGDATVTPIGGIGSYTVSWSDGATGLTQDSLCAGVYSYLITDSIGCSMMLNVAISNVGAPTVGTLNEIDVSCFGIADGSADVTPAGGIPPYNYLWVPGGQTSNAVTGLEAGSYAVEISDSSGCILAVPVTIDGPSEITIETLVINETCGDSTGSIALVPNGGAGGYTYNWAGGILPPDSIQTNLPSGLYTVTVSDANGCSEVFSIAVNSIGGPEVTLSGTNESCFNLCDATVLATATGGSGLFEYLWTTGETSAADSNLCAGTYSVTVTDTVVGCVTTNFIIITSPDSISMSFPNVVDATCNALCNGQATLVTAGGTMPYTYSWPSSSVGVTDSLLCADTLTVSITDLAGCVQTQDVIIGEPTPIDIALDSIDASCSGVADGTVNGVITGGTPGYSFDWAGPSAPLPDNDTITSILTGSYVLTVTDDNGCEAIDSIMVNTTIFVIPDAGPDTAICFGTGPLVLTGTGMAVSFEWYDLDGNQISTMDTLAVDSTGCYVLLGIDGLCSNMDTVCVVVNALPEPDAGSDFLLISGESVVIGGSPTTDSGFDIAWIPSTYLDDTSAQNPLVQAIDTATLYYVMVTDTNGCIGYDSAFVDLYPNIFSPTGFSPNGDGLNDGWEIDFIDMYPDCDVEIFNRWGQQLFYSQGYQTKWDGTYNGKDLPEATYYYIIRLNHPAFPVPYTGPVTILR